MHVDERLPQQLLLVLAGNADSAVAAVRLDALRSEIAGDEKQLRAMFASFFRRPIVGRAYEEAKGTLQ